jgi:hypothetical protein
MDNSELELKEVLQRIYDIYGYAWPDQDRRMIRKILGLKIND